MDVFLIFLAILTFGFGLWFSSGTWALFFLSLAMSAAFVFSSDLSCRFLRNAEIFSVPCQSTGW